MLNESLKLYVVTEDFGLVLYSFYYISAEQEKLFVYLNSLINCSSYLIILFPQKICPTINNFNNDLKMTFHESGISVDNKPIYRIVFLNYAISKLKILTKYLSLFKLF